MTEQRTERGEREIGGVVVAVTLGEGTSGVVVGVVVVEGVTVGEGIERVGPDSIGVGEIVVVGVVVMVIVGVDVIEGVTVGELVGV